MVSAHTHHPRQEQDSEKICPERIRFFTLTFGSCLELLALFFPAPFPGLEETPESAELVVTGLGVSFQRRRSRLLVQAIGSNWQSIILGWK